MAAHTSPPAKTPNENTNVISSVLLRWKILNRMRVPGMHAGHFRFLSTIAQCVPIGSHLTKGRSQLGRELGMSPSTIKRCFAWAYATGLLDRKRAKNRGKSDRVWPVYERWLDYVSPDAFGKMHRDARESETKELIALARLLAKGREWEQQFLADVRRVTNDPSSRVTNDSLELKEERNRERKVKQKLPRGAGCEDLHPPGDVSSGDASSGEDALPGEEWGFTPSAGPAALAANSGPSEQQGAPMTKEEYEADRRQREEEEAEIIFPNVKLPPVDVEW